MEDKQWKMHIIEPHDREEWLRLRNPSEPDGIQGLGSSEVAAACGHNRFRDPLELWQEKTGHVLITGVTVARKDFIEGDEAVLGTFLDSYKASVDYINENAAGDGAAIVGHYGIVPEAVAKAAIPYCNIVLVTGEELKASLSGYLDILYEQNPQSVGGAVPGDDFYYSR